MFELDLTQGRPFEIGNRKYVIIKTFSWPIGDGSDVEVNMCAPHNFSGVNKWIHFEPKFFIRINKKENGGDK